MAKIKRIVTSEIEGRDLSDRYGDNSYVYEENGAVAYYSINGQMYRVMEPGKFYGAGSDSGDGQGLNTVKLIPVYDSGTDQYIIIDPTVPNHVHIRAGGTIDASNAELIIGGEQTNVIISDGSDAVFLNGSGGQYLNSLSSDNQIATIGDVNASRFGASASFYSTADQGPFAANAIQAFTFNNYDWATGITLGSLTQVTMANAGKYNIAFSAQMHQTNGSGVVNIWLNKNGTPLANSNTKFAITANNPFSVAALNLFVDAAADDYYELMWSSDSQHTVMEYEAETGSGATLHPAVPSVILTVNQVG